MATKLTADVARQLNQLSRNLIQQILENHGYAVYDSEATDDLLNTIREDIESGEVSVDEIEMLLQDGAATPGR